MSQTQTHTDSLDGADHDPDVQKKAKSRRPASTFELELEIMMSALPTPCDGQLHDEQALMVLLS